MDSRLIDDDLLSAQFVDGGRDPKTGLDCQGLFIDVMRRFGNDVTDKDVAGYATVFVSQEVNSEIRSGKWESLETPEEGCAVVMAIDPEFPDLCQHLGVYIGKGYFIHIMKKHGVKVTRIDDRFFKNKIRGYYRWIK